MRLSVDGDSIDAAAAADRFELDAVTFDIAGGRSARSSRTQACKWRPIGTTSGLMPRRGRVVPELGDDSLRELIVSKHRVIYRVNEDASSVEVVFAFWGALPFPYDEILDG